MAKGRGGFIGQDGLNAPDSPTGVTGTAGDQQVSVAFTAPTDVGGSAITGYRVQDGTNAHGASGSSSPITVTGLTNDTAYTFNVWAINAFGYSAPSDASGSVTPVLPAPVGLFFGGFRDDDNLEFDTIDEINIASTGNATDFGDLTSGLRFAGACSSSTRGLVGGGDGPSGIVNVIQYVTIASAGNAQDFGDLTSALRQLSSSSNSTRGVWYGGRNSSNSQVSTIQYVTIASTGNASSFGSLTNGVRRNAAACASPTRGLFGGGDPSNQKIEYITFASTGDSTNFGDLPLDANTLASCSSSTRGLFSGGYSGSIQNFIHYVTIASTGNSTDFGDLLASTRQHTGTSSETRGIFAGGNNDSGTEYNTIQYVTIASTGNATDFGDLTAAKDSLCACSDSHGGLQ